MENAGNKKSKKKIGISALLNFKFALWQKEEKKIGSALLGNPALWPSQGNSTLLATSMHLATHAFGYIHVSGYIQAFG